VAQQRLTNQRKHEMNKKIISNNLSLQHTDVRGGEKIPEPRVGNSMLSLTFKNTQTYINHTTRVTSAGHIFSVGL
jgi:hypothetical protein